MAIKKPAPKKSAKSAPPASTLVLLVRHGQTPTTGKLLPGRAPGLHLSDVGRQQAEVAAERIQAAAEVARIQTRMSAFAAVLEAVGTQKAALQAKLNKPGGAMAKLIERQIKLLTGQETAILAKLGVGPELATQAVKAADRPALQVAPETAGDDDTERITIHQKRGANGTFQRRN